MLLKLFQFHKKEVDKRLPKVYYNKQHKVGRCQPGWYILDGGSYLCGSKAQSIGMMVKRGQGKEGIYDQTIGGGMESYECAVGGGTSDDYAVDPLFSGDDRMDEAYDYDVFKTDGGEGCGPV